MDPVIQAVCIMEREGPDDLVFTPVGVVIGLSNQKFTVYSNSAEHNRLRTVLSKYPWADLQEGIRVRDTEYRLTEITAQMTQLGWEKLSTIPTILRHLYQTQQRHLFFLERHVNAEV